MMIPELGKGHKEGNFFFLLKDKNECFENFLIAIWQKKLKYIVENMLILFRFKLTVNNQECYPIFKKETFFDNNIKHKYFK